MPAHASCAPPPWRPALWSAVACAAFVAALAVATAEHRTMARIDRAVLRAVHRRVGTTWDGWARAADAATDSTTVAVAAVLWTLALVVSGRRRAAIAVALTLGSVLVTYPLLKALVGRPRPTVRVIPHEVSEHAFPSGHAAGTAALLGAMLLVLPAGPTRFVAAVAGSSVLLVVAVSQLALGAHAPSDLLAGCAWAATCALLTCAALRRLA